MRTVMCRLSGVVSASLLAKGVGRFPDASGRTLVYAFDRQ